MKKLTKENVKGFIKKHKMELIGGAVGLGVYLVIKHFSGEDAIELTEDDFSDETDPLIKALSGIGDYLDGKITQSELEEQGLVKISGNRSFEI